MKGFEEVKKGALSAGALGCSISGAGASIFAVADDPKKAEKIGKAMEKAFRGNQVIAEIRITRMDRLGARMIK